MASPRTVIYVGPDYLLEERETTEDYTPTGNQSLVEVLFSGINPGDLKSSGLGYHSTVAGYDITGKVLSTGPDSPFKPGDIIAGFNKPVLGRGWQYGGYQSLAIAEPEYFVTVPSNVRLDVAAALPVIITTASDGLFNNLGFGLPAAGIDGIDATGKSILIWGGGSQVGLAAIQLAKAAGFSTIFTTASPKNHSELLKLGATKAFDYRDPNVVEAIVKEAAALGTVINVAFDAVCAGADAVDEEAKAKSSTNLIIQALKETGGSDIKITGTLPVAWEPLVQFMYAAPENGTGEAGSNKVDATERAWKALKWAINNYGTEFHIPNVRVIEGIEDALKEVKKIGEGKGSFEKVVIKQPF